MNLSLYRNKLYVLLLALALVFVSCADDREQREYLTENVIVVIADGARYSETLGDPDGRYIPRLHGQMAQHGVIKSEFYNTGGTYTLAGHTSLTTGRNQIINNSGKELPKKPSYLQYWLKKNPSRSNDAWIITSKDKLEVLGNCLEDEWNGQYLPNTDCGINGIFTGYREDTLTLKRCFEVLDRHHPNLLFVNFWEPDKSGHGKDWELYIQGVEDTDEYAYMIWEYIQQDPNYAGRTTLFFTNDHGRHCDDVKDGFFSHGCGCDCCRHLSFYAYGPDFKEGVVDDNARDLRDIVATIDELLHLGMDTHRGDVMWELFIEGQP